MSARDLFDDNGCQSEVELCDGLPLESVLKLAIARFGMLDHEAEEAERAFDSAETTRPPGKCREFSASGFSSDDLADSNRGEQR